MSNGLLGLTFTAYVTKWGSSDHPRQTPTPKSRSHFLPGSSTVAERAWTMAWLSSSIVGGFLVAWTHKPTDHKSIEDEVQGWALLGYMIIFGAPAIGGLVVVGE
jgi:hypothetical protein